MEAQPDFGVISRGFGDLGSQFELCMNLTAIDQGARLVEMIAELRVLALAIQQAVGELGQQLRRIELRMETGSMAFFVLVPPLGLTTGVARLMVRLG